MKNNQASPIYLSACPVFYVLLYDKPRYSTVSRQDTVTWCSAEPNVQYGRHL